MTTPRSNDSSYTEARIGLAIQAFKKCQQSLQAAALTYDAPIATVRRDSQPSNRKLSSTEEETLIQRILSMDQRGMINIKIKYIHCWLRY
jgi:precorrin-4 methylase